MGNDFWVYHFAVNGAEAEQLLAQLSTLPFNGFAEEEGALLAYLPAPAASPDFDQSFEAILSKKTGLDWHREWLPDQNWNQTWEDAFQPIQVDDFVGVRAEFHPPFEDVQHDLLIHPRMAFGTGHHATTFLVMRRMQQLDWASKSVFDYGCGTGILAILARFLGADPIWGVDIEAAATENTRVNMTVNGVDGIEVFTGDLSVVPPRSFDIILANINRNVILASLAALYQRIQVGGDLLVSGILCQDEQIVLNEATAQGWQLLEREEKDGWLMLHFQPR